MKDEVALGRARTVDDADARTTKSLATRNRLVVRRVALVVHRYVGLLMAVFLMVAGLTGSVIVYKHELEAVLSPSLF